MNEFPPLGSTRDLAEYVRKPESTVRHWRQIGTGPNYFRIGKSVRYRREDVEDWINRQIHAALLRDAATQKSTEDDA